MSHLNTHVTRSIILMSTLSCLFVAVMWNGSRLVVHAADCLIQTFQPYRAFQVNRVGVGDNYVHRVVVADFNHDGRLDAAATVQASPCIVAVLWGDGAGNFSSQTSLSIPGGGCSISLAEADFNNDGNTDVAAASPGQGQVYVYLGDGAGGFTSPFISAAGTNPFTIVAADFNQDGKPDIAAVSGQDQNTSVLLGDGTGHFAEPIQFYVAGVVWLVATDLNHDGKIDIATANDHTDSIAIFLGDGTGHFGTGNYVAVGKAPTGLVAADFDGDSNIDIAVANQASRDVSVLYGDGAGRITHTARYQTGEGTVSLKAADINGDGTLDLVTESGSGLIAYATLLTGDGQGGFNLPVHFPARTNTVDVNVGDFNGDGKLDLVTADYFNDSVSLLLNSGMTAINDATPPSLTPITPIITGPSSTEGAVVSYSTVVTDNVGGGSLRCTVPSGSIFPVGTTNVSCTATDACGNSATTSFSVTVVDGLLTFAPPQNLALGTGQPRRVAVEDLNNDGKPDIAATNNDLLTILFGDGTGNFGSQSTYFGIAEFPYAFATGDFNHDGKPDVAVGDRDWAVNIFLGNGAGEFSNSMSVNHSGNANDIVVGDYNRDGKLDLALGGDGVSILLGDGTGSFAPTNEYIAGVDVEQLAAADFNNDGKLDLMTANTTEGDMSLLLGDGAGGFSLTTLALPPSGFCIGDFNADGKIDLAVSGADGVSVALLLGDGIGGFGQPHSYPTGGGREGIPPWDLMKSADFNGDGKLDVAILLAGEPSDVAILLGDGTGRLSSPFKFGGGGNVCIGFTVADLNLDRKPDIVMYTNRDVDTHLSVLLNTTYHQTPIGTNTTVVVNNTTFTFDNVTAGGTTTVTPIDPATAGQVPGGFAISNSVAYEIATTATFTGSVTLAFKVPGPISQADFNNLAILHNENGTLVDVTAATPARDYSNLTIYARTSSFSPFYLARRGAHINTLFDQSKAYKRGSTIPIKLQVLNASNSNISSSGTSLVTRDLRLMSGNTTAPVLDSGNANPDYTFRYDPTLGGTGGGYIFNLSTKGLASGQYVLSFYVGSDRSFLYTIKFEVK